MYTRARTAGVSSRIRVRSIVGRFLEHSRIFYFENGGEPEVYLGSADWMPRNLYERVEILFPLKDAVIRERVCTEILGAYLSDTCKARLLCSNGGYSRVRAGRNGVAVNAQDHLLRVAASADGASRVRVMKATEPVDSTPGMTASDNLQEELDDAGRGDV